MIRTRLYFDDRREDKEGRGRLRLYITKNGTSAMLSIGIPPLFKTQWQNGKVINHPDSVLLNRLISIKLGLINRAILESAATGAFAGLSARGVAEELKELMDPELAQKRRLAEEQKALAENSFTTYFMQFLNTKSNPGTKNLYKDTLKKISSYCTAEGINFHSLTFKDINITWLDSFEEFCLTTQKQNTAARHLRDIRAVFNAAIDDGKTDFYPFRKFKIHHEETVDKSYTAHDLRTVFSSHPYPGGEEEAIDMFKLMFCLIGINSVDLAYAGKPVNGRLIYNRKKTHKSYSIKIEPEAKAIIEKYIGKEHMLNILERTPNYKTYFNRMGKTLRKIGLTRVDGKRSTGKAILPDLCIGSARTSWATIAQQELDIPREVIAAALGHHTVDVTDTYLRTDWKLKVDKANRMVLDWVFYGEKK